MDDLLREFLTETNESLDTIDVELVRFEQEPNNDVPQAQKVKDNRPPMARDRCTKGDGVDQPLSVCPRPPELTRVLAGAPERFLNPVLLLVALLVLGMGLKELPKIGRPPVPAPG